MPVAEALILVARLPAAVAATAPIVASLALGCVLARGSLGLALGVVTAAARRAERFDASKP